MREGVVRVGSCLGKCPETDGQASELYVHRGPRACVSVCAVCVSSDPLMPAWCPPPCPLGALAPWGQGGLVRYLRITPELGGSTGEALCFFLGGGLVALCRDASSLHCFCAEGGLRPLLCYGGPHCQGPAAVFPGSEERTAGVGKGQGCTV